MLLPAELLTPFLIEGPGVEERGAPPPILSDFQYSLLLARASPASFPSPSPLSSPAASISLRGRGVPTPQHTLVTRDRADGGGVEFSKKQLHPDAQGQAEV